MQDAKLVVLTLPTNSKLFVIIRLEPITFCYMGRDLTVILCIVIHLGFTRKFVYIPDFSGTFYKLREYS